MQLSDVDSDTTACQHVKALDESGNQTDPLGKIEWQLFGGLRCGCSFLLRTFLFGTPCLLLCAQLLSPYSPLFASEHTLGVLAGLRFGLFLLLIGEVEMKPERTDAEIEFIVQRDVKPESGKYHDEDDQKDDDCYGKK